MVSSASTHSITLGSGDLSATISPIGAELTSLLYKGSEWLWQGDGDSWPRQAPVLFPHCGRTADRTIRVDGTAYPEQPIHGFAPASLFALTEHSRDSAVFTLSDSPETRALYPFSFKLDVRFSIGAGVLEQVISCSNGGTALMPVAAGFHPGFVWPLPGAGQKADHCLRFETDEPHPIALPDIDGLMGGETMPSPVRNRVLALNDDLFRAGSAILDRIVSRSVWFGVPGHTGLKVDFDTPALVLWRWPGPNEANYLCIEPWAGLPDPAGFIGDLASKPGVTCLEPGASAHWTMRITPGA
jgi:galactose mutarotase-like enzyme